MTAPGSRAAVIVGASHAGVQAAQSLRQAGWQEPIRLVSAESDLPYHRPPLSKAFLAGERTAEQIVLRGPQFYAEHGIDLLLDFPVTSVDPAARAVVGPKGRLDFSALILATGADARRLAVPGADLAGIHTLRDLADARRLKAGLEAASTVVVIGGGFIGLEVAATAAKAGKDVTVVEAEGRLLARALPAALSDFLAERHAREGVRFLMRTAVVGFEPGAGGGVGAVRLHDGRRLDGDLVVVGIGGVANLALAADLGLAVEAGGILVDADGATSAPGVYAAGDCASHHGRFADRAVRIESVQNATDQARAAAGRVAGRPHPLAAVPWFWTDQYDLKVQMAGLPTAGVREILRGDPAAGAFSLIHLAGDRLAAVYSVNRPGDHMAARKLIDQAARLDPAAAADAAVPLLQAAAGDPAPTPTTV